MADQGRAEQEPAKRPANDRKARPRKPWPTKPRSEAPRWLLGTVGIRIALPGLDAAYRRQRLTLARVRRSVADVATERMQLEWKIGQLEQQADELGAQNRIDEQAGQAGTAGVVRRTGAASGS
ncbi:MAG TPA: hypothetical protein VGL63_12115 [Streptosporangiaceae bacterium]|jgi:hypothetical protein